MQEEPTGRLSELIKKPIYILSILAGIFPFITFLAGLLGINGGGILWPEDPWVFTL